MLATFVPATFLYSDTTNAGIETIITYLKGNLPDPENHTIYFDYGNQTLDTLYKPIQKKVDKIIKSKGYTSKNLETKEFIGADHSEKSFYAMVCGKRNIFISIRVPCRQA